MKIDLNTFILFFVAIAGLMLWGAILISTLIAEYFKHKRKGE